MFSKNRKLPDSCRTAAGRTAGTTGPTLTEVEVRALGFLHAASAALRTMKASELGDRLWPKSQGQANAPHARTAGKLLHGLKRRGLAQINGHDWGAHWVITGAGTRAWRAARGQIGKVRL